MIKITEAKPHPTDFPKAKVVTIGGIATGKIEPSLRRDDRLSWHACIDAGQACRVSHTVWLLHGHAASPQSAVIDAVIHERALLEEKLRVLAAIEVELGTAGMTPEQVRGLEGAAALCEMREGVTAGVAETTLGVSGQEPPPAPLVMTGPGGDFRTEQRPCACCKGLFTAVAGSPGKYCQECLDRRAARRAEQEQSEIDSGGVFDGTRVISDADAGL